MAYPGESHAPEDSSSPREEDCIPNGEDTARYLGPTSGAAFLAQVKDFMAEVFTLNLTGDWPSGTMTLLGSVGRYQVHDTPTHRSLQSAVVPQTNELNTMLADLKHFIQDGHDDYSIFGGIFYWGNFNLSLLSSDSLETMPDTPHNGHKLALIHAALAVACVLDIPLASKTNTYRGDAFFERAKFLMGSPLDTTRSSLLDLPLLVMLAVYLIEVNRTDVAYMYVSSGLHIAIVHGMHQECVGDEYQKRSFWTLYTLDRWLSIHLGRPPTIMDEAIHLALPMNT